MTRPRDDITLNPQWKAKQLDRLLGFEILTRTLHACYHPMEPDELFDKTGAHTKFPHEIIANLRTHFNANGRKV